MDWELRGAREKTTSFATNGAGMILLLSTSVMPLARPFHWPGLNIANALDR